MMLCQTLVADPPWKFRDKLPGGSRGAARNYRVLSLEEIRFFLEENGPKGQINLGEPCFADMLAPDCRLFLWRVASMQQEALDTLKAWGFELKTELVWIKKTLGGKPWFGMGRTFRGSHETCLVATRGHPDVLSRSQRTIFEAPVLGHSVKPDLFYEIVQTVSPGPYLELFARRTRVGWIGFGDELDVRETA